MLRFQFDSPPRLVCQRGAALALAPWLQARACMHAFVVTDPGLVRAGVVGAPVDALRAAGLRVTVYDQVEADPPEHVVLAAVQAARDAGADGVIGLGGGSSLDTAKLVALLAATPQALPDIYGPNRARGPRLPLVQVPTTAGTGSEATPTSVVSTPDHQKRGVISPLLLPDVAVLDATLTLGLPPAPTAMTGIDAMVHAIEAYTTRHLKNPVSDALAVRALQLLHTHLGRAVQHGDDLDAREGMLLGSALAGMAFANAPVAAIHALAHPLGSHFHVPHGLANALVMVPVLRFNLPVAGHLYAELARALDPAWLGKGEAVAADAFITLMAQHVSQAPIPQRLRDVGIAAPEVPTLAQAAMDVRRLLDNNLRDVQESDALALYSESF
ncbi:iron-containing alcohol dehydrogenase [Hydrogenophaga sp. BPS33]|uniref:iron-containing alcohol dehydrogenase n=1 Tax=Hydrogenophaga sp. BPS33 TaxID=2651974 RepID=UPI001320136A|nr:iron-containing alcohol dehydrogenase [Hydrogenophaga sp. BPS33]QHE87353.1 iron-containing alcohol dehydrogenase [Hydrogenophaga sp. BPS33]